MLKTSGDYEKEFIEEARQRTGKSVDEWFTFIKSQGLDKRNDIMSWLKSDQNLNHLQASLLTGMYLNGGKPVYVDEDNLLENQLEKVPQRRPIYEAVAATIEKFIPDTRILPKKTYVSFNGKREYAAINIKSGEIRLGLDLGEKAFEGKLSKSKLTGPMPRISHMAVLQTADDLTPDILDLVLESYHRAHP